MNRKARRKLVKNISYDCVGVCTTYTQNSQQRGAWVHPDIISKGFPLHLYLPNRK